MLLWAFLYWRSKAVFLLWAFFLFYVLCLSCCLVCPLQPCGHLLGKGWSFGSLDVLFSGVIVTFPCVVLGQVWYAIISIPAFCILLTYIMSWLTSKILYLSECYPQSVDIQISIPAISSTTTSVSEFTIIRVWLSVKEACIMWTNIWVSASSDKAYTSLL